MKLHSILVIAPIAFLTLSLHATSIEDGSSGRIETLMRQLASPSAALRRAAVEELKEAGAEASPAVPAILKLLSDPETIVRNRAVAALGYIKEPSERIIPELIDCLADPEWTVRYNAAFALVRLGEVARPAVLAALHDDRPWVRLYAADTVRRFDGVSREEAVNVLLELLHSENYGEEIRQTAALAVGKLGPEAAPAVPKLLELSMSETDSRRTAAMKALGSIAEGAREAVPRVRELLLHDQNRYVRREAAFALGAIGDTSSETIAALASALADPEQRVRNGAIAGLKSIGSAATEETAKMLLSESEAARVAACDALTEMGPSAHAALPDLQKVLNEDPEAKVRMVAAIAVGAIAHDDDTDLQIALRERRETDPDYSVRFHAGNSLVRLTGDKSEAAPTEWYRPGGRPKNQDAQSNP